MVKNTDLQTVPPLDRVPERRRLGAGYMRLPRASCGTSLPATDISVRALCKRYMSGSLEREALAGARCVFKLDVGRGIGGMRARRGPSPQMRLSVLGYAAACISSQ